MVSEDVLGARGVTSMPNEGQSNSGDELSPTTDGDAVEPDATAETEGVMDILPPDEVTSIGV